MKLKFKRRKLSARTSGPAKDPTFTSIQENQTVKLVLENLAVKQEDPLDSFSLELFNKDAFFNKWKTSSGKVYDELESILANIYGFNDVLTSLEQNIKDTADPQFEAVDSSLEKELNALSQFRILLTFVRHIFDERDVDALREFMLRHEGDAPKKSPTDSKAISAVMKELYNLQNKTSGEIERVLRGDDKTMAVKVSRGRRASSTPVNE